MWGQPPSCPVERSSTRSFMQMETRFKMLTKSKPEEAKQLWHDAQHDAENRFRLYEFNRFYQPDINLDELEIQPNVLLSTPQALRLPLTWIGILYGPHQGQPGCHQRGARPRRCDQTADGRSRCDHALFHLTAQRCQPYSVSRTGFAGMDGRARIRIGLADEGQHEPAPLSQSFRL